jgi:tRNA-intron endonuclease
MEATLEGDTVRLDPPGRERFYDSRGYGRPRGDGLELTPVEAAHLLYRDDLESVDGLDLRAFLAETGAFVEFLVYKDLRDRGFYLSPAREGWVADPTGDLVVYPRGQGPWDDAVAYRVRVVSERESVPAADLTGTLAVVDEESEITYFETGEPAMDGATDHPLPEEATGSLLSDRVVLWDPPEGLYGRSFYGQPLEGRESGGPLQCSLLEAADLAERGVLTVEGDAGRGAAAVRERGRAVEGERFDRRLTAYRALREAGAVPKTGYKFGADFRVYRAVESVESLGHSAYLVRVVPDGTTFDPRELALDVRLAGGVRKTLVVALVDGDAVEWRSVARLTP